MSVLKFGPGALAPGPFHEWDRNDLSPLDRHRMD